MINFVICEDEKILSNKYKIEIEKFMMNYDVEYNIHIFDGYGKDWLDFAKKDNSFKIYLLDIKTPKGSGLDAARLIREEFDDWVSMIMIITSFAEYKYDALGKRLMLVDFINKLDNCEERLKQALIICMKNHDNRHKTLKYIYKNTAYNIELRHILSIEKEQESKKCTINTLHGKFFIQGSLKDIMKKLDNRFLKISRGAIINLEQVQSYNIKENKLKFKDGTTNASVSRDKKKEVMNYVRGVY